jgi:hypothetical protein
MPGRGLYGERDQAISNFAATLGRLCDAVPALAAALVDGEGETVDYSGRLSPYDTRVAAAEWQLVVGGLKEGDAQLTRPLEELQVRARRASYAAFAITEGYVLVLLLPRYVFNVSRRAVVEAVRELCQEAGLPVPARYTGEHWYHTEVQEDDAARPCSVWLEQRWVTAVVIGRFSHPELIFVERGYRVMLEDGNELTLVRERLGRWYREGDV